MNRPINAEADRLLVRFVNFELGGNHQLLEGNDWAEEGEDPARSIDSSDLNILRVDPQLGQQCILGNQLLGSFQFVEGASNISKPVSEWSAGNNAQRSLWPTPRCRRGESESEKNHLMRMRMPALEPFESHPRRVFVARGPNANLSTPIPLCVIHNRLVGIGRSSGIIRVDLNFDPPKICLGMIDLW